jgi:hypothetical protein
MFLGHALAYQLYEVSIQPILSHTAPCARAKRQRGGLVPRVREEAENTYRWIDFVNFPNRMDSTRLGKIQIHQHHLWPVPAKQFNCLASGSRYAHKFHFRLQTN